MLRVRPRHFEFLVPRPSRPATSLVATLPATPAISMPALSMHAPPAPVRGAAATPILKSSLTLLLLFIEGHGQAP